MKNKRVLCSGCNKPIKIENLGLIEGKYGEQSFYHDNFVCLVKREMDNLSKDQPHYEAKKIIYGNY